MILPIAGIILTFIACYELIQLVIAHNNLANFETWIFFKWVFKTFVAVTLITNTFNITMAVFDVAQHVVSQSGSLIVGSTAVDGSTLATMQSILEAMDVGPLFGIFLQSFNAENFLEHAIRILYECSKEDVGNKSPSKDALNVESEHDAAKYVQKVLGEQFVIPEKKAMSASTNTKKEHNLG